MRINYRALSFNRDTDKFVIEGESREMATTNTNLNPYMSVSLPRLKFLEKAYDETDTG